MNYFVDTTGIANCVRQALGFLDYDGTCVVLGATEDITFNVQNELMGDGKSLIGVIEGDSVPKLFFPILLDYYKKGQFPFDKLILYINASRLLITSRDLYGQTGNVAERNKC